MATLRPNAPAGDDDAGFARRMERLVRMLNRINRRTERDQELAHFLREAERVGAKRERERCAEWLESLECGDDGLELLLSEVARALRKRGLPDDH